MARFHQPLQRTDGRWDYTVSSDDEHWTHPAGYCAQHGEGHATAEEATECWIRYQLDHYIRLYGDPGTQKKCEECGAWTTARVRIGHPFEEELVLCTNHNDHETSARLYRERWARSSLSPD